MSVRWNVSTELASKEVILQELEHPKVSVAVIYHLMKKLKVGFKARDKKSPESVPEDVEVYDTDTF